MMEAAAVRDAARSLTIPKRRDVATQCNLVILTRAQSAEIKADLTDQLYFTTTDVIDEIMDNLVYDTIAFIYFH
jgi:hypothetical protein